MTEDYFVIIICNSVMLLFSFCPYVRLSAQKLQITGYKLT